MIKRIHSLFTALVIALTLCVFPLVSGCAASDKLKNENAYSVAEWLGMVEDSFNLGYYTNAEPVMQNVLRDDSRFDTVQIAAEWGLIDVNDNIDLEALITKEFCANTLVCAMNFTEPETVDIKDSEKIYPAYLDNVMIAVKNGIFSLDSGKFDPSKTLSKQEAESALITAYDKWVNFSFDESFDKSVVKENVVNLGGLSEEVTPVITSDYSIDYSGSRQFFTNGVFTDNTTKTITFKTGAMPEDIKVGSVLCFPADAVVPVQYGVAVDSVTENEDGSVTLNTHNAVFEEIYQDFTVRTHETVNFDNMRVFAPNGVEVLPTVSDEQMMNTGSSKRMNLRYNPNGPAPTLSLLKSKKKYTIDLGEGMEASIESNGSEVTVKVEFKNNLDGGKFTFSQSQTFGVDIDSDYDIGWFLNVKKAYAKCTVKAKSEMEIALEANNKKKFIPTNEPFTLEQFSVLYQALSQDASATRSVAKSGGQLVSKKLFDMPLGNGFFLSGRLNLSLEGKLTITLEASSTFGIEYVKGNLRPISNFTANKSVDFSGKAEAKVFLGVTWQIFGRTIADAGAYIGAGVTAKTTLYHMSISGDEFDAAFAVPLTLDTGTLPAAEGVAFSTATNIGETEGMLSCIDIKAYPIFTAELCTKESVIGKYIGGLSCEFLGEKQPFFTLHFDDGKRVSQCDRGVTDTYDIEIGDKLELNLWDNNKIVMSVGEENTALKIKTLPNGLTVDDVSISVEDPSIASAECLVGPHALVNPFDNFEPKITVRAAIEGDNVSREFYIEAGKQDKDHFKLKGLSDGVTKITVKAGTYSQTVDVVVGNGGVKEESAGRLVLSDTMIVLSTNESHKLSINTAPDGYTASDFTFSSSDPGKVSVDGSGNVTAHGDSGSAIIYAASKDGKYTTACMVLITASGGGGILGDLGTLGGGGGVRGGW